MSKGVFKGRVQGIQIPPPEIFRIFLKSEGKEIERKGKKGCWGKGYLLTYFWGLYFFEWGLDIFRGV